MDLSEEVTRTLETKLLNLIPKDGSSTGNKTLIERFLREAQSTTLPGERPLTEDDYWNVRNGLIEQGVIGKGRGKGGSVYRVLLTDTQPEQEVPHTERSLYEPFTRYLNEVWVKEYDIKQFVTHITAFQGRRNTGGQWTRPDVALIALRKFAFVPGHHLDVITFELKPAGENSIAGVFETAAHSAFAHKSYLCIEWPNRRDQVDEEFSRIEEECKRFGIGFMVFSNVRDWGTFEIIAEAERQTPDPAQINKFITLQFEQRKQHELLEMIR